jgi:hypothetical protein
VITTLAGLVGLDPDELLKDATVAAREIISDSWDLVVRIAALIHAHWQPGETSIPGEEIEAELLRVASGRVQMGRFSHCGRTF